VDLRPEALHLPLKRWRRTRLRQGCLSNPKRKLKIASVAATTPAPIHMGSHEILPTEMPENKGIVRAWVVDTEARCALVCMIQRAAVNRLEL
jgi:hypothetical protein